MLNDEQARAIAEIYRWLATPDEPFFLLSGSAGTGKSYCMRELKGSFLFSAPTNKATKVLRDSVSTFYNRPICRTIYSLLGLTLDNSGEVKVLAKPPPGTEKIDFSRYTAVIVDEGSMVNKALLDIIREVAKRRNVKFLFLGDPAQLPPINEVSSLIWNIKYTAHLSTVMRYDNAILELATELRDQILSNKPGVQLKGKHTGQSVELGEGIWRKDRKFFEDTITEQAKLGLFSTPDMSKVIAWRNVRVNSFNSFIRDVIFPNAGDQTWLPGDRVIFTAPAVNNEGNVIATTDDEGKVLDAEVENIELFDKVFKVWVIKIESDFDKKIISAIVLHEDSLTLYCQVLGKLAEDAKAKKKAWSEYWSFKECFNELKYAYAITAHRSQGSTYDTSFVCHQDIFRNQNEKEALKCLYVAATRASRALVFS